MGKYQICQYVDNTTNAGGKAPSDIVNILKENGFEAKCIRSIAAPQSVLAKKVQKRLYNLFCYYYDWLHIFLTIPHDSELFWQGPNRYTLTFARLILRKLQRHKNVKLVCLIHDIDELRYNSGRHYKMSKKQHNFVMRHADAIIVHNNKMKTYLIDQGINADKLISLEIFDYLISQPAEKPAQFEKSMTIAGNLDIQKCGYLKDIGTLCHIHFHLYGSNYSLENQMANVTYHGIVDSGVLPSMLTAGFGLVWDGSSIARCDGTYGNYLRYNNPHKLSLYLASGLPVVIWNQAAEATFVQKNQVGICVDSLQEAEQRIASMGPEEYRHYANNALTTSQKLTSGDYLKSALGVATKVIWEDHK